MAYQRWEDSLKKGVRHEKAGSTRPSNRTAQPVHVALPIALMSPLGEFTNCLQKPRNDFESYLVCKGERVDLNTCGRTTTFIFHVQKEHCL